MSRIEFNYSVISILVCVLILFLPFVPVYSIDKSSNFKPVDYQFMRKLRAENSQNREDMTHKLTQKLLERKRNGYKADITDIARKVS